MTYVEILCLAVLDLSMPRAHIACDHMQEVAEASELYGVKPETLISLIRYESRWSAKAVSRAGACGLTQVLPKYTRKPRLTCRQLKNPRTAIFAGAKALSKWISRYGRGSEAKGLCGYNAGYTCGKRYNRRHGGWRYSRRVLKYAKVLKQRIKYIKDCIKNRTGDDQEMGCSC